MAVWNPFPKIFRYIMGYNLKKKPETEKGI